MRTFLCIWALFLSFFSGAQTFNPASKGNARGLGSASKATHTFALGDSSFLLDGRPFQMISGEMHYTRVPREAWRARMKMAKAMGLNTIGTYVFWNVHEPEKGRFDFSGNNDVAAFVRTAWEEGLWVVLRPSPYVCAEWEFGGYPYWLEKEKGLVVRSKDPLYLTEYRRYIREVGKQLAPLQVNHGGNILMIQVENEYGSYGSDKEYLDINRKMFIDAGFDGLLYTCDPAKDVSRGYCPGLLPAINGTDDVAKVKRLVRTYHGGRGPFYIAEWYPAWFDWWGAPHHTVPAARYAARLDSVLSAGLSINIYMFHGGTTRGFMNGANVNDHSPYEPQISSYDYDAPLDEAGNATPKFMAFREVIGRHLGVALPAVPAAKVAVNTPAVRFTGAASVFDILPGAVFCDTPLTFEDLGQAYGYVLYRTEIVFGGAGTQADGAGGALRDSGVLRIGGLRDYAIVFLDGRRVGVLDRRKKEDSLVLRSARGRARLDILVENLGRVNFGPYLLHNLKGIVGAVRFAGRELKGWKMYRLPMSEPVSFAGGKVAGEAPVIRKGILRLERPADTYLDMSHWGKGCVW
ncbi:MAG TPA: beta-galactosidase family protein, partial [Puia sp.]|nr:beta-galactosidase family protein [Puia sp.]